MYVEEAMPVDATLFWCTSQCAVLDKRVAELVVAAWDRPSSLRRRIPSLVLAPAATSADTNCSRASVAFLWSKTNSINGIIVVGE